MKNIKNLTKFAVLGVSIILLGACVNDDEKKKEKEAILKVEEHYEVDKTSTDKLVDSLVEKEVEVSEDSSIENEEIQQKSNNNKVEMIDKITYIQKYVEEKSYSKEEIQEFTYFMLEDLMHSKYETNNEKALLSLIEAAVVVDKYTQNEHLKVISSMAYKVYTKTGSGEWTVSSPEYKDFLIQLDNVINDYKESL